MKKLLLACLVTVVGAYGAFAQGRVNFATFNGANPALGQVFMPDGSTGVDSDFVGQLYWSMTELGTYAPLGSPIAFSDGAPGYLAGSTLEVPGVLAGNQVWCKMFVWGAAGGPNYEAAIGSNPPNTAVPQAIAYGITVAKSRTLGGINEDGDPVAPQSFNTFANLTLTLVPEPSTFALVGLASAAMLVLRRRK